MTQTEVWQTKPYRIDSWEPAESPVAPVTRLRLTVLIAANNEEESIRATLDSVRAQDRLPDQTVVAADNCRDATVAIACARLFPPASPLYVYETIFNARKKAGALNQAWALTKANTDLFICIDADTVLPANALAAWEAEFIRDKTIAGCSAKFTMLSPQEMAGLAQDGLVPDSAESLLR